MTEFLPSPIHERDAMFLKFHYSKTNFRSSVIPNMVDIFTDYCITHKLNIIIELNLLFHCQWIKLTWKFLNWHAYEGFVISTYVFKNKIPVLRAYILKHKYMYSINFQGQKRSYGSLRVYMETFCEEQLTDAKYIQWVFELQRRRTHFVLVTINPL